MPTTNKDFPNGFEDWYETFYEIVSTIEFIVRERVHLPKRLDIIVDTHGTGGLYELAHNLTDKFEAKYEGKVWDGDYFDAIEEFLNKELNN